MTVATPSKQPANPWSFPTGRAVLLVTALAAIGTVPREGLLWGLFAALVTGAIVVAAFLATVWPLWVLSGRRQITTRLERVPGVFVVIAWPVAAGLIWLVVAVRDTFHLSDAGTMPIVWLFLIFVPLLTLRWLRVRRSARTFGTAEN